MLNQLPRRIRAILSPMRIASSGSWVTMMQVARVSRITARFRRAHCRAAVCRARKTVRPSIVCRDAAPAPLPAQPVAVRHPTGHADSPQHNQPNRHGRRLSSQLLCFPLRRHVGQSEHDIVQDRHMRKQRIILKHQAERRAFRAADERIWPGDRHAIDQDPCLRFGVQPRPQCASRLSCHSRNVQADTGFPRSNRQAQVFDRRNPVIIMGNILIRRDRRQWSRSPFPVHPSLTAGSMPLPLRFLKFWTSGLRWSRPFHHQTACRLPKDLRPRSSATASSLVLAP